jgi:hypothetical protein
MQYTFRTKLGYRADEILPVSTGDLMVGLKRYREQTACPVSRYSFGDDIKVKTEKHHCSRSYFEIFV